jgi:hypothetical protein
LRRAGARVEVHDDHFAQDALDEVWLTVGQRGWLAITKDKNIRRRTLEREALLRARVGVFFVAGGNLSGADMAARLVAQLGAMRRFAADQPRPFLAIVTMTDVRLIP